MSNGVLDNYLSPEEEAYFKAGGNDKAEEKYEQTIDTATGGKTTEQQSSGYSESESELGSVTDGTDDEPASTAETSASYEDTSADAEPTHADDEETTERDLKKAVNYERGKRKELRAQLEEQAKKTAQLEAVLAQMQKLQTESIKPAVIDEPIPDKDTDPIGYHEYQINRLQKTINEQTRYLRERAEYEQKQAQHNAFIENYRAQAHQFSQKAPDFQDAYKYLLDSRKLEHMAAGFSEQEATSILVEEEMSIVAKALQDKVNPAERMYNLAKARGFTGKAAAKTTGKTLDSLKKGLDNSKSLKSGGGQPPDRVPGINDIDSMSWEEFDNEFQRIKRAQKGQ